MSFFTRRKFMTLGGLGLIGGLSAYSLFSEKEPYVMDMKFKVMRPYRDFFLENNIDPQRFFFDRDGSVNTSSAAGLGFERWDRNGHRVIYNVEVDNGKPVRLPTARRVWLDIEAGYIIGFLIYLPTKNLNLDEAIAITTDCAAQFANAGYERTYLHKRPITPGTIAEYGNYSIIHSKWRYPLQGIKENSYFDCSIQITSSAGSIGSTLPPAAAVVTSSDKNEVVYMLRIEARVSNEIAAELSELASLRGLAHYGVRNAPIPLQDWYNDPDWRPEGWDGKYI